MATVLGRLSLQSGRAAVTQGQHGRVLAGPPGLHRYGWAPSQACSLTTRPCLCMGTEPRPPHASVSWWGRGLSVLLLTICLAAPLEHEVDGIDGPRGGVVAEAHGGGPGTSHLEQLPEGLEDLGLGTERWGCGT